MDIIMLLIIGVMVSTLFIMTIINLYFAEYVVAHKYRWLVPVVTGVLEYAFAYTVVLYIIEEVK